DSVARPLQAGMAVQVLAEVVLEDALEVLADGGGVLRRIDAVELCHPCADHAVGDATAAVLIAWSFLAEDVGQLPVAAGTGVGDGLLEILAGAELLPHHLLDIEL